MTFEKSDSLKEEQSSLQKMPGQSYQHSPVRAPQAISNKLIPFSKDEQAMLGRTFLLELHKTIQTKSQPIEYKLSQQWSRLVAFCDWYWNIG